MHGDMVGTRRCAASTGPFSALSWAGSSWIVRVCLARAIHSHGLAGDGSRERPKRWLWRPVPITDNRSMFRRLPSFRLVRRDIAKGAMWLG